MMAGLRMRAAKARLSIITPSNDKERGEMAVTVTQILAGKGPAKGSELLSFVAGAPEEGHKR